MSERWVDLDPAERELLEELGVNVEEARVTTAGCPPPELVKALSADFLPEELRVRVAEHVGACVLCKRLARDLEEVGGADLSPDLETRIRAKLPPHAPRAAGAAFASKLSWPWIWRPVTAAAALAVIALVLLRQGGQTPRQTPIRQQSAPPTQTVAPAENLIPIEKPAVKLTAASLVLRGADGKDEKFLKDLAPALDAYRKDQYVAAEKQFARLSSVYPGSVEVRFYLGVSRLFTQDNDGAVTALRAADEMGDDTFGDDAAWYLMLAQQRAGNKERAEAQRKLICAGHGPYSEKACRASIQ